ncbi:MAG: nucleoside deaminase [Deltaproteobacteria bacterium]|jgi:tRNA(adenine34) deaminase|nr:nucleoside deaminase [Deltaproteobacteria bacterium]
MPLEIDSEATARLMAMALDEARLAAGQGEVPAGAVVAEADGTFLASGRNQVIALSDPTAHAEILAMRKAAGIKGNYRLGGLILVSTIEPCPMCLMAAIHARLDRIFYGAPEPKWGAAGSRLCLHGMPWLNHRPVVAGGLMAEDCAALIQAFFRERRGKNQTDG